MKDKKVKSYKFESRRRIINDVERILTDMNEEMKIPEDKFVNFQIAVSEALINCIVHGNQENINKSIFVKIENLKDYLKIYVKDEGSGFDFNDIPDPTDTDNLYKEHGRGIFIIKSLVDNLEINSGAKGTEFILTMNK
ncbi:MAG: ATP-binding protein [Ignavibacteria bacterium]|nr:ATP-binding protein [Ignavibacteria bacterium]